MFRNRQSSQRPSEELFERFKKSFPDVRSTTGSTEVSNTATAGNLQDSALNQPRLDTLSSPGNWLSGNILTSKGSIRYHEDLDPTPRAPGEPFRFTPSLLDPNSSAFAAFANQPPGYYTPTPNAPNGLTNHVNDIPTPSVGISIGTPLALSNTMTMAPVTATDLSFAPQTIQPQQFQNYLPFTQPLHPQYVEPAFDRPPSGPGSPMDLGGAGELEIQPMLQMYGKQYEHEHAPLSAEKFRYHVTLNAPTAMIKHPDEIPVTYLNKGQAYTISIADTQPPVANNFPLKYRTYIRISFHDESQRAKPAQCWQLWKEGRGTNEAHQRGGRLQAVEFVENSTSGDDEKKKGKVELESASFDGFAVTWSPSPGQNDSIISVRFNFLSTDFSHSKGVKGIPVRLCAKTELVASGSPRSPSEKPEICFCKVKLFRDHGAERKLANDVLHVKKTIEKLRQQLQQTEGTGMKLFGKKKRDDDLLKSSKPGKALKHKRTWSMSSASSVGGGKSAEEEVNEKLQAMQDMFTSTRPVSVLYLRGTELDDPDLHPVQLLGDPQDLTDDAWARRRSSVATTASSFVSPSPSSASLSQHGDNFPTDRREWAERGYQQLQSGVNGSEIPVKVKVNNDAGILSGWIEAIGIDSNYRPPADRPQRACMCIYILPILPGSPTNNQLYRAVYLPQRTQACLTDAIAAKCGIDTSSVVRTTMVNAQGLTVLVDDDVIQQMKEGQDIKVQVIDIEEESPPDWNNSNGDVKHLDTRSYELKLIY
ncbi:CP2 transcription factor-domain-containing protein [Kalaharituber pfeilii]|nr:CP2 transcription factor-domain-containing protein [Kalaharituber pfeilii]